MLSNSGNTLKGPWGHEYWPIAQVLERFHGERILFVPNPGNAGDSLINLGAVLLFTNLGIDFEIGDHQSSCNGRIVFCSGGGNLVEPYPNLRNFIERNEATAAAFVILPHTVRAYSKTLAAMGPNSVVFAREEPSYRFLQKHLHQSEPRLCHDMAFLLDPKMFYTLRQPLRYHFDRTRLRRDLVRVVRLARMRLTRARHGNPQLNAFRTDVERRTGGALPARNFDLSEMFAADDMSSWSCMATARALRASIAPYSTVKTDRLHVSILAALMGKSVQMFDNAYGKNRDVFEHSMQNYFSNVEFVSREENTSPREPVHTKA